MFIKNQNMRNVNRQHFPVFSTCKWKSQHAVEPECSVPIPVQYWFIFWHAVCLGKVWKTSRVGEGGGMVTACQIWGCACFTYLPYGCFWHLPWQQLYQTLRNNNWTSTWLLLWHNPTLQLTTRILIIGISVSCSTHTFSIKICHY